MTTSAKLVDSTDVFVVDRDELPPRVVNCLRVEICVLADEHEFHPDFFHRAFILWENIEKLDDELLRHRATLLRIPEYRRVNAMLWIVAVDRTSGTMYGFAGIEHAVSCNSIAWMFVAPEMRRRGIGSLLLEKAEQYLRREEPVMLHFDVDLVASAWNFAQTRGFSLTKTVITQPNKVDACVAYLRSSDATADGFSELFPEFIRPYRKIGMTKFLRSCDVAADAAAVDRLATRLAHQQIDDDC